MFQIKDYLLFNFFLNKYLMFIFFLGISILIILGFLHFLGGPNFLKIEFGPAGAFISAVVTFIAVLFGSSYWINKQSEAAMELLRIFNLRINNMIEIMQHPMIYQQNGYYPFTYPESQNHDDAIHTERPCRLIYNEFGFLKKEISLYSSFLRGDNLEKLTALEHEVATIVMEINSCLLIQLADQSASKPLIENYDSFIEHKKNLVTIATKFKEFLGPFI